MGKKMYKVNLDTLNVLDAEFAEYLIAHEIVVVKVRAGAGGGGCDIVTFAAASRKALKDMIDQFYGDVYLHGLIR